MKNWFFYAAFSIFQFSLVVSWDPNAGLVTSWTKVDGVTVTATSSFASANKTIDNNDATHWTSSFCLPMGYINRQDINILLGTCSRGFCTSTQSSASELAEATDGSLYHTADVPVNADTNGVRKAELVIDFQHPVNVTLISLWGVFHTMTSLAIVDEFGTQHQLRILQSADSHNEIRQTVKFSAKTKQILINSTDSFSVKEISAMGSQGCTEQLTIDLGQRREIGYVRTRHWAGTGNALSLSLKLSNNSLTWDTSVPLNPDALHAVVNHISNQEARYIALEYRVSLQNYKKVYCWEVDAWDRNGEWGPPIVDKPQGITLRELLGVNGIWGWGHTKYSFMLKPSEGPGLYNLVASHARNYHNLDWDVTDPDNDPRFDRMNQCNCTSAKSWLNWDWEYTAWMNKNLKVDASIQFTDKTFSHSSWNHPETSAFNYGRDFATHFGPKLGNGLVNAMEVGNEPWDYDAGFYSTILKGMSAGARSVDNEINVLPGAFQAHNKHDTGNYIGTRVHQDISVNISAINFHTYSYRVNENGVRVATYPEKTDSSFNTLRNIVRWRETNTPLKPVWVTEWGWDASGGGEDCRFSECVTEKEQAIYGIRGLFILSRSNVERATWFFYANSESATCNHIYCRSGLTTSKNHNFAKKAVFYAFESILSFLGDKNFLGIVKEDEGGYVYAFGKSCNLNDHLSNSTYLLTKSSHIVAWKPVDVADGISTEVIFQLPLGTIVLHGWKLTGSYPATEEFHSYHMQGHNLAISLTPYPVIFEISHVHANSNEVVG